MWSAVKDANQSIDRLFEVMQQLIATGVKKDVEQDSEIQRQQNVDKQHNEQLKKIKTLAWIGIGIAVCALVIAIIGLII